ncbi:MAG: M20 family metallopeptidase [Solirubrobacteraceae bacterium]
MTVDRSSRHDTLSALERQICDRIAAREDELVQLLRTLIAFDTRVPVPGAPARDEHALQAYLARRLQAGGDRVHLAEPDPRLVAGHRMIPDGFDFAGRPQLVARFPGSGDGPTLLCNGHIDVVDTAPLDQWQHPPFAGTLVDGRVHGRGACDMKGGVASMVFAAEVLTAAGVQLAGELIVNPVSEEESTGAGGLVSARTLRADAAIVTEPTALDVWTACRGSLLATITIPGRSGHAGLPARHPDKGGAVNAIEKLGVILDAIHRLRDEWALRYRHPFLSAPDCVPTIVQGGEWVVSYPSSCRLECHLEYLPEQADDNGWGARVEHEFEQWIARAAAADPWLAGHPPQISWEMGGVPPAQVSVSDPIVTCALAAVRAVGHADARIGGMDNWHDGATLTVEAGIPAICLGPGDLRLAHTTAEYVPVAELVTCAQALAVTAMRFCGVARSRSR